VEHRVLPGFAEACTAITADTQDEVQQVSW